MSVESWQRLRQPRRSPEPTEVSSQLGDVANCTFKPTLSEASRKLQVSLCYGLSFPQLSATPFALTFHTFVLLQNSSEHFSSARWKIYPRDTIGLKNKRKNRSMDCWRPHT